MRSPFQTSLLYILVFSLHCIYAKPTLGCTSTDYTKAEETRAALDLQQRQQKPVTCTPNGGERNVSLLLLPFDLKSLLRFYIPLTQTYAQHAQSRQHYSTRPKSPSTTHPA